MNAMTVSIGLELVILAVLLYGMKWKSEIASSVEMSERRLSRHSDVIRTNTSQIQELTGDKT